jgi:hypothetical protein
MVPRRYLCLCGLTLLLCGCDNSTAPRPVYEPATRELMRLDVDSKGDGWIDIRTYARGSRVMRSEIDADRDGRIERWEYLAQGNELAKLGTASVAGGAEDTWTYPETNGEVRVDRSQSGEGSVTRHEFYRAGVLARAEEDTNGDGLMDKWEAYAAGRLRSLAFDSTQQTGQPDRRLLYDAQGQYASLEIDTNRDGQFERVNR